MCIDWLITGYNYDNIHRAMLKGFNENIKASSDNDSIVVVVGCGGDDGGLGSSRWINDLRLLLLALL